MDRPFHHLDTSILDAIREYGPLCRLDLIRMCGISDAGARIAIRRLRERGVIRIAGWKRGLDGKTRRPTAVFGLGNAPDAEFVPLTKTQIQIRYRRRHKVFQKDRVAPGSGVFGQMARQLGGRAA